MGLMLQVLISLCTIAVVLTVPRSSGSILQRPAASPSIKPPLLNQFIKRQLPFLSPAQLTVPPPEHGLTAAVPAQPLRDSALPITAELPHAEPRGSTAPSVVEPPLLLRQLPAASLSNYSSLTPASDAPPPSAPLLVMKPPEAVSPLSNVHSLSFPPLTVPLPLEPPPPLADEQPHTSTPPLVAIPSNSVAPLPLAEPPWAVNVRSPGAQPFLPSPLALLPNSPPVQSPISPNGSPSLPQQIPPHASPWPFPEDVPSIIPSPLAAVPPRASAMPSPPFPSAPLLQQVLPIIPPPLPSVPPHASVISSAPFPFRSNASSPLPQPVPSHASSPSLPQEPSPIVPSPLPAEPPYASVTQSPPFLPNPSSPLPLQVPLHASSPPLLQEAPPIIPSPLSAVPPHALFVPSPPFLSNVSSPLPQPIPSIPPLNFIVPSHAFVPPPLTVPLPQEPPASSLPLPHAVPPYASTLPPFIPRNASSPPSPLVLSQAVPPTFVTPPHALVPPPLMEPLPPEPPEILLSPPPAVPPPASAIPFPPIPRYASSPPFQPFPSHASLPTFAVPSHASAPPPLMMPLPKEPPSILSAPPPTMPPRASTMQSPPVPPCKSSPFPHLAPPQASPVTFLAPPSSTRPTHAAYLPPSPIELPHTFPPPLATLPGAVPPHPSSPTTVSPPLAPALVAIPYPPEKSQSYMPPPPTMQGIGSAVPPHASQREVTQNAVPPPLPASQEPSPSSRISPRGSPSVHQVMPRSQPPFSPQIEIPSSGTPFWKSNASVPLLPPLSSSVPSHTVRSAVQLVAPPSNHTISSGVPLAAPPGTTIDIASPPLSSQMHPPSVGFQHSLHHPSVEGISPHISPSTPSFTRPSDLAPMRAALSPKSSASEGSHSSAVSPSPSIHKQPRDETKSAAPASILVRPPAPSQQGQVESPSLVYAPEPSSPPSQGSPMAVVPSKSPSRASEISPVPSTIAFPSPKISPSGSSTSNTKKSLAPPIRTLPPPPPNHDCAYLTCQEPYTNTPPGAPCGCVWPMQVGLRLSVALYTFFPLVSELAREIAAGVSMNQSQVRIMGANAAGQDPEKTIVLIDLVPLNDKFDYSTAMLTSQKFWHNKVAIDKSIFGDYDVFYVRYPGLPPSPPMAPDVAAVVDSMPYSVDDPNGSQLHPLGVDVPKQKHKHKLSGSLIAIIVLSAVVVVLICGSVTWFFIFRHAKRDSQSAHAPYAVPSLARPSGHPGLSNGSGPSSPLSIGSSLAAYTGAAKTFSASEIEKATNNFNPSGILGEGGFGCVYCGTLEDGTDVAVKVLKRDDQQGGREFLAEVEMLNRLHHRNLIKLIGICIDERMRCLVYELVPKGSVDSHLHGTDKEVAPLDWASRLKIALGAARGLAYLHEDSSPRVIHRDFKSSNILLDNDFTPKVSDFGLARTALDEENRHISTRVMGTFGYVAPEYAMTGHLLVKSDVYSYGVVLLELLIGRKPVDMSQPPGQENLVAWARPLLTSKEGLQSIIDPSLGPDVPFESVAKVAAIASMCVQSEVSHRPFMGEVVQALKLVCNECDDSRDGEDSRGHDNLSLYFDANVGTSPLAGETPDPFQTQLPHGFPQGHDLEKGLSMSEISSVSANADRQMSGSFRRHSASGPMKTAKG